MLNGVVQENREGFNQLLNESTLFLQSLQTYYTDQVKVLMAAANAETRFITAYVDKVALSNINHSLVHLDKLQKSSDPRLAQKLTEYLRRTEEFLAKTSQNSQKGATYIPVPFHTKVAAVHLAQLQQCTSLLEKARAITKAEPSASKSWFSFMLNLGNILPHIRAVAFGLKREDKQTPSQELLAIHSDLLLLEGLTNESVKVTKTTRLQLKIDGYTAEPAADSDYHQHVPPLKPLMSSFKNYVAQQTTFTKEGVHEAVRTEYPTPKM